MSIETFGAICPHCEEMAVLSKIEPNTIGGFQFDACVSCGFIEFETNEIRTKEDTTRQSRIDIWSMLKKRYEAHTIEDIAKKIGSVDPDAYLAFDYSSIPKAELSFYCIKDYEVWKSDEK
jgi:Zn ribbon nucleic-acid-binding protein